MISPISKKKKTTTTLQVQHTSFLYISLPLLLHDYSVKLSSYTFYEGNVVCSHKKIAACVPLRFLFQCRLFSPYWLLTFLIFTPPLWNFYVVFLTKFVCFVFLLSLWSFFCYPLQPRRLNLVEKETALLFFFSLNVWVTKMTLKWTSVITKLSKEPRLTTGMKGKAKQHKDFGR